MLGGEHLRDITKHVVFSSVSLTAPLTQSALSRYLSRDLYFPGRIVNWFFVVKGSAVIMFGLIDEILLGSAGIA